jgi:hypothetical protein
MLTEDNMKNIIMNIGTNKIIAARIENDSITDMITVDLINNNYYLNKFLYLNYDRIHIQELLKFLINNINENPNGLNILCDNYPYQEELNSILLLEDFKFNYINYISNATNHKIERINSHFYINDKSEDVLNYLLNKYREVNTETSHYLNSIGRDIDTINLDDTNIAVIRNDEHQVVGVARFAIMGESMFINSLYAEDTDFLNDLINLIKSLTSRNIEIGIMPVRTDLIKYLSTHGFKINQADYIKSVSGC